MKKILVLHLGEGEDLTTVTFLEQPIEIRRIGTSGETDRVCPLIEQYDGQVDAIALEGFPTQLRLGHETRTHLLGMSLKSAAQHTPVVDGSGVRDGLERWAVVLADRAQPGIFSEKIILAVPGLNHRGLVDELARHSSKARYADPFVFFNLPNFPLVGSSTTLERMAGPTLDRLREAPFRRLTPQAGTPHVHRPESPFHSADVLAGDVGAIRRYSPALLRHKTIVVEHASAEDLEDLKERGASIVITLMPALGAKGELGQWSAATIEAVLAALRPNPIAPLTEDTYLDLMANFDWLPAIRYLRPEEVNLNKFAFVIQPLNVEFIRQNKWLRWTRFLPADLVETLLAYLPPLSLSRITGGASPATSQRIEGYLLALSATPRKMMQHGERFTYSRLNKAARLAERKGARLMGLGAFTNVVGDAGITVANEADIAITSGNSLTIAVTLEATKQAVTQLGATDPAKSTVMIVGATGSIGMVCARLLAQAIKHVVLVSFEPAQLIELKRQIQQETPSAQVTIATQANDLVGTCDLIVMATSALGQRVIDITQCKPGAVICDVARPSNISAAEAALRPDVLVIESGEVLIPGDIDFGYDIGLPPKTAYACLAETMLLALEGRFEDYTLGRQIEIERVKEIYGLFKKHGFKLAGLCSFGQYLTVEDVAQRRVLAEALRADADKFAQIKQEAAQALAKLPAMSQGVSKSNGPFGSWALLGGTISAALLGMYWLGRRQRR